MDSNVPIECHPVSSSIGHHNNSAANNYFSMLDKIFIAHNFMAFYSAKNFFCELKKSGGVFNDKVGRDLLITLGDI